MARRKSAVPVAQFSGGEPPDDLIRYDHGRRGGFTDQSMSQWLLERATWRASHTEPLPSLACLERAAMWGVVSDQALIDAEIAASRGTRPPKFEQRPAVDRPASPEFSANEGVS